MRNANLDYSVSYAAWILGQTSAILGMILSVIWGFDLVVLQAQYVFTQAHGEVALVADAWHPSYGPPLAGLGIALAGWMVAHLQGLGAPAPVVVGGALNLLALILAMLAAAY